MGVKRAASHPHAIAQRVPVPLEASSLKTGRFSAIVKSCGHPDVVDLWSAPEQNKEFMAAVRQNRVMTVKRQKAGRKDFGFVGFLEDRDVSYLVFPKPLNAFSDRRVIGINYDQIQQPGPVGRVVTPEPPSNPAPRPAPGVAPRSRAQLSVESPSVTSSEERKKRFTVAFEFIARATASVEVEAENRKQARDKAAAQVRAPDMNSATITRRIKQVKPAE